MGRKKKNQFAYTPEERAEMETIKPAIVEDIDNLTAEIDSLKDKNLRLMAEMENVRKNALKDKQSYIKYKNESIAKDILPVVDDFERCLQNMPKSEDETITGIINGVNIIYNKLLSALTKNSIEKMHVSEGDTFNVDMHDAVSMLAAGEDMSGKIVAITEPGYTLAGDKVLRYTKVVVGQ